MAMRRGAGAVAAAAPGAGCRAGTRRTLASAAGVVALAGAALIAAWRPGASPAALERLRDWLPPRRGGSRAKYEHAVTTMQAALRKARGFEAKAAAQKALEHKDEHLHLELVKAARDRADALRRQDRRVSKVADSRMRLEDALRATQQVVSLHDKRLAALMAEQRADSAHEKQLQREIMGLERNSRDMAAQVDKLTRQTAGLTTHLSHEEQDTHLTHASAALEKMLRRFSAKHTTDVAREERAESKAVAAHAHAHAKQTRAFRLQARADVIAKKISALGCAGGDGGENGAAAGRSNCSVADQARAGRLQEEEKELKREIMVVEQEVLYQDKQAKLMHATARLQHKMADTDAHKVREYGTQLHDAQRGLEEIRKDLVMAPAELKAAHLNLKLAHQAAARVHARLTLAREQRRTAAADRAKAKALARLQAREIAKLGRLRAAQTSAVMTAARAEHEEGSVLASQSKAVRQLMAQAGAVRKDALAHSSVAARWDGAAVLEEREAAADGKVAGELAKDHTWAHVATDTARDASQMRYGLQLMAVESAIRRFRAAPTRRHRAELERLQALLADRLGRASDAAENAASIRELNTIEDELDGVDASQGGGGAPPDLMHAYAKADGRVSGSAEGREPGQRLHVILPRAPRGGADGRGAGHEGWHPKGYMFRSERGADGRRRAVHEGAGRRERGRSHREIARLWMAGRRGDRGR